MKNILVTGAGGQLGSELRALAKDSSTHHFLFTDFETLDIRDKEKVAEFITDNSINLIINCAAYTAVDLAEENPVDCDKLNHAAVADLAELAEQNRAGLIHFSTDYVFDGTNHKPYTENDPTSAKSTYGITKLASERVVLAKCSKAMVIRTSWLYSSYGNNFVKTVLKVLGTEGTMRVVADQVGTPTLASDLAKAVITILNKGIVPGIYHYSNEGACSWYDFAKMVQRFAKIEGTISPISSDEYPVKAARPHYSVLNKSKIKETFGIEIPFWVDSLELCLEKIIKNN